MGTENEIDGDRCNFDNLPHYVLRILLSYLDSSSLYVLSKTCSFLKEAVEDPIFWKYVDARSEPHSNEKIQYITERIHEKTTHLFLQGYKRYGHVPQHFFDRIGPFENLKVLALENLKLYGSKISLKDFPSCLEELSLRKTYVKSSVYFFQHSAKKMHNLRVLILDECSWVTCSFLLSVSKFENLEIISAVKCLRAHLNMVPYLNVAKYGCKKLKVLDCRFTGIGGELLRTFYSKQSIQRMYFQSYKSSEVDYYEKISCNAKGVSRSSVDINFNTDLTITDNSLHDYSSTTALNAVEPIADSVLYKDPYPECQCGYKESDEERVMPEMNPMEDDDVHVPPAHTTTKFVCQKHMKDVEKLPTDFKDFFVIHQKQFHSDVTSDVDSDSDSSGSEDDRACCIYAMGTKMVILPNVQEPANRSEMDLSREGYRQFVPFNIFIVNPLDVRNNRHQNEGSSNTTDQPSTSGGSSNSTRTTTTTAENSTNVEEGQSSNRKGQKRKLESDSDSEEEVDAKKKKDKGSEVVTDEINEDAVNDLVDSTEDICNRLNVAIENGMVAINRRFGEPLRRRSHDGQGPSTSRGDVSSSADTDSPSNLDAGRRPRSRLPCERVCDRNDSNNERNERDQDGDRHVELRHQEANVQRPQSRALVELNPNRSVVRYRLPVNEHWLLKKKISLKRISLRGYKKITDIALTFLRHLDIELIDLTYTSVTKKGIEDFLVYNPNCRIIHPLYCTCKPKNPF